MIQKSALKGSQGGSSVGVMVGIAEGTLVGDGGSDVGVGMVFVFTATTGVSVTPVVVQEARISDNRKLSIGFIRTNLF